MATLRSTYVRLLWCVLLACVAAPAQTWTQASYLSNRNRAPASGLVSKHIFLSQNIFGSPTSVAAWWLKARVTTTAPDIVAEDGTAGYPEIYKNGVTLVGYERFEGKAASISAARRFMFSADGTHWVIFDPATASVVANTGMVSATASPITLHGVAGVHWGVTWGYGVSQAKEIDLVICPANATLSTHCTYTGTVGEGLYLTDLIMQETDGTRSAYYPPTEFFGALRTTVLDLSGNGNTLTLTGTTRRTWWLGFNGTTDKTSALPSKGAAWTVINCSDIVCYGVDSASGSFVNGIAQAGALEFDIATAGGYSGRLTARYQYNRVLSAQEHLAVVNNFRLILQSTPGADWAQRGVVSFTFDDGCQSNSTLIQPVFAGKSPAVQGTSYIVTDFIGSATKCNTNGTNDPIMSVAELQALAATGWSIGSHSKDHVYPPQTDALYLQEVAASKTALLGWGITPLHWAYPGGNTAEPLDTYVGQNYLTGRGYGNVTVEWNPAPIRNVHVLKANSIDNPANVATFRGYIDRCANTNPEWIILTMHDADAARATMVSDLIDYALGKGCAVKSVKDAWTYIHNPILAGTR